MLSRHRYAKVPVLQRPDRPLFGSDSFGRKGAMAVGRHMVFFKARVDQHSVGATVRHGTTFSQIWNPCSASPLNRSALAVPRSTVRRPDGGVYASFGSPVRTPVLGGKRAMHPEIVLTSSVKLGGSDLVDRFRRLGTQIVSAKSGAIEGKLFRERDLDAHQQSSTCL